MITEMLVMFVFTEFLIYNQLIFFISNKGRFLSYVQLPTLILIIIRHNIISKLLAY